MGSVQRKINGRWVDIEEFNRLKKIAPISPEEPPQEEAKEQTVVEHAREVLARGDHHEMGSFLASYSPDPAPKSKDDRIMSMADFIADFE